MPGRFSWLVTPYLREIVDACAERGVERIVCRKSSQVGWTDGVVCNLIGWRIDTNPGRTLVLFPREKTAIDFNDEKLEPMIEASASLGAKVQLKSRAAGNRQLFKKYPGGFLKLIASNAPGDVKSTSAPLVIVEEPDDCNQNVRGQGDSIKLAEDRTKSYHGALLVIGGTPTISGVSAIDNEMKKTDRRLFHVPCHHCGEAHALAWENVRWEKDSTQPHPVYGKHHPETAHYACPNCGGIWNDAERNRNVRRGRWVPTAPFTGARGYDGLNELYSPFPRSTMAKVVEKFLEAHREFSAGRADKMVAFHNGSLGRSYEYASDLPSTADLAARGEDYAEGTVPADGLVLVAGVDVQHNRLALAIWAYGRDGETWLVFWGEEYGVVASPADPVWSALDAHVDRAYAHERGAVCHIEAVSVDSSDGQTSDAVYAWVRRRDRGRCKVMAVKGRSTPGGEIYSTPPAKSLIDPTVRDKASRYGVKPFMVGTEKAKDLLLGFTAEGGRIKRCDRAADGSVATGRGAGRMHWYREVRPDFLEQLADSEVKIPNARAGGKLVWTLKAGKRNEALDCTVYAEHAARAIRLHVYTDAQWTARENALRPITGTPDSDAQSAAPTLGKDAIRTTRGGFLPIPARVAKGLPQ
jgi:phage terminase large subunit GpA-like protein